MLIRRFQKEDAKAVSVMIATTLRITNSKDYSSEYIEKVIESMSPDHILERASWTHFYVIENEEKIIIGCGAVGPYWGSEEESSLFTIFVHPDDQGKGIGKLLIQTLEQDEYFLRAKRVEIPASITGQAFYRRLGYEYKNGITEPDEEGLLRLEKYRN